ncbi:MAG: flagellar type III secretion system pore protein FliP [Lachnospiraceae bacterium]|nr:flagellar type III secretion system pore protein FliP [Lachnospiraceae bacterium]
MKNQSVWFKIVIGLCLLISAGILLYITPLKAHASGLQNVDDLTDAITSSISNDIENELNADNPNSTFSVSFNSGNGELNGSLRILLILTFISFIPAMLVMLTSFTRIIIVLHFTRTALGTQTAPPNQVLIGLAVFLTLFIMAPVLTRVNNEAIIPFDKGEITAKEALDKGMVPLREFMYGQTQAKDVATFMEIANLEWDGSDPEAVPSTVLIPAFVLSELRTSFIIGFLIYIPFIVIDMVVSSILMSMGMMMLPPTTISTPFKILLFVLADGWNLVIVNLVRSFY